MRRFYFNVDGKREAAGVFLSSMTEAKSEAMKLAKQLVCEQSNLFWEKAQWKLAVTDGNGLTMFQLEILGTEAPAIKKMAPAPVLRAD